MTSSLQPIGVNEAEEFTFQASATIASITAGLNKGTDQVQVLPDSFFCLFAIRGSTNLDNFGIQAAGENVDTGNSHIYGPPRVPNNFSVRITQDNNYNFCGIPIPQAVICSSGYVQGHQLPFPILYKPLTQFQFEFFNTMPQLVKDGADSPANIDLEITLGLYGYNVPVEHVTSFLAAWPAYQQAAATKQALWLRQFTSQVLPGLTA